ncbi:MAG TPA: hypothetical protein VMH41_14355 [Mycobacteriales bacterium]|nr:hypothetical protein [Mycobacteriales bacterium]
MTSGATVRYPDLAGRTVVLAADRARASIAVEVARALAAQHARFACVIADRSALTAALAAAAALDVPALGVNADPALPSVWERVTPHTEQHLGPIDAVVTIGTPRIRRPVASALLPDMLARGRGVLIEIGPRVARRSSDGPVRHRSICINADSDPASVAAFAVRAASNTDGIN